jgi:hypothetical protein
VARELGTQFELRLVGPELRLRVREGAVRLEGPAAADEARAGDELHTRAGALARGTTSVSGPEWGWVLDVAPPFALEGGTLDEFARWACRESGWTLRFADAATAARARRVVLHGSLAGLTPSQAIEAVLPASGFGHRREGEALVLAWGDRPGRER